MCASTKRRVLHPLHLLGHGFLLWGCMISTPDNRWVAPTDPHLGYEGLWFSDGVERFSLLPGAGISFELHGSAEIWVGSSPVPGLRLVVQRDGASDREWIPDGGALLLEQPDVPALFRLRQIATRGKPFFGGEADRRAAEFRFQGLRLLGGSRVRPPPPPPRPLLEFVGDSISCGDSILGRGEEGWKGASDARLSFPWLLGDLLRAETRLCAFPGATLERLIHAYPRIRTSPDIFPPALPADWVILNVGANDRNLPKAVFKANLTRLLELCAEANPKARILLLNFFRMSPDRLPLLREVATAFPIATVEVLDVRSTLVGYSDAAVHPDAPSHRNLASLLRSYLSSCTTYDEDVHTNE